MSSQQSKPADGGGRGRGRGQQQQRGGGRGGGGGRRPQQRSRSSQYNKSKPKKGAESSKRQPSVEESTRQEEEELARKQQQQQQAEAEAAALEKQRQEQEKQAVAQALALEQEERLQSIRHAKSVLQTVCDTLQRHKTTHDMLEPQALAASRQDFVKNKKKLKTDLKKCTAVVKKVKSGAAYSSNSSILKDIQTLNLSRYVEEVVAAVLESKPKVADILILVDMCAAMHQRYPDFLDNLLNGLWEILYSKKNDVTAELAKSRRVVLRILTDFYLSGLTTNDSSKMLVKCIEEATGGEKDSSSYTVQDASLVVAFGKAAGPEIFRVVPKSAKESIELLEREKETLAVTAAGDASEKEEAAAEETKRIAQETELIEEGLALAQKIRQMVEERAVDPEVSEVLTKHCMGAYQFLANSLVQTHGKLLKLEKRCEQDRLLSGSLTEAREKGLVDARKLKENLQKSVEALSDVLDQPIPRLEEAEDDADQEAGLRVEVWTKGGAEGQEDDYGPFDDEETRDFYCDIPDLLTTIPPALLSMTPEQIEKRKQENLKKYGDIESEVEEDEASAEVTPTSEAQLDAEEDVTKLDAIAEDDGAEENAEENKDTPHYRLMVLLEQELPECHRREQIDELTEKFCTNHGSSRNSRKRLSRTLFLVPRNRLDLLPYYSRMTATLDRVWPDVAPPLVTELEQQFHGQAKFKKNQNIESRFKTARYIGELTKFRVAPPIVFLRCLRRCLDDFTGSNVDVACCLLESSGRFLYRLPHTNAKLTELMDAMTRLSKAKNLDERLQSLITAAFYSVKPPPSGPRKTKEYPPLEAYLRHLLMVGLEPTNSSVAFVSKQIVRLPWGDPSHDCGALVCRLMLKACRKGRYRTIQAIAAVAEKLRTQRAASEVTVRLIDAVLEELRWALEYPNFRDQQRVITYARLLGELYAASQVSGQLILRQLYDFINLGHEIPDALREVSKRLASSTKEEGSNVDSDQQLPVYSSATRITQTIQEDEEMEETELETKTEDVAPERPQPVAVSQHSKYDPRVPTPTDPPNSAYRIKLVCTMLEVAAKSIVTRSNLGRTKGFLAAFQRYLFTKTMLPTDVEFALLDTFDILDSRWRHVTKNQRSPTKETGFPRYMSWLDAHNATVAVEESEYLFLESKKMEHPSGQQDESKSVGDGQSINDDETMSQSVDEEESVQSLGDSMTEANDEENDLVSEQDEDADEYDDSGSAASEAEADDDNDSDDSGVYSDEEEEFDEEAYMRQLEEEAFERELRRVTMDALERGKSASRKQVADYMPSGSQIVKKKVHEQSGSPGAPSPVVALGGKAGISFQLLKKGGKGKVEAKEFVVPKDTNLAVAATKQDDEAARERDVIKQRVLQYEADSATAEYSGGNVYLEQEKLQVIRNRPLTMSDIDKNFGTSGGNLRQSQSEKTKQANSTTSGAPGPAPGRRGGGGRGGQGRGHGRGGRGRGRSSSSGRTLYG